MYKSLIIFYLTLFSLYANAQDKISSPQTDLFDTSIPYTSKTGTWLFKYQVDRQLMDGALQGSTVVEPLSLLQNQDYKKLPYPGSHDCTLETDPCLLTDIADNKVVDLHAFSIQYQQTPELSWKANFNYLTSTANMYDRISPNIPATPYQISSSGVGDIQLLATTHLAQTRYMNVKLSLGVSVPLGGIDQLDGIADMTGNAAVAPYSLQTGSGTYDFITKVSLTSYYDDFEYGGSFYRITRTGLNTQYYNLGDALKLTAYGRLNFSSGTQFRTAITQHVWSPIVGRDLRISNNTLYTGGKRLDGIIGVGQKFNNFALYIDYAHPLLQYLNGVQIKTSRTISLGIEYLIN